jgi:hypothetical protein
VFCLRVPQYALSLYDRFWLLHAIQKLLTIRGTRKVIKKECSATWTWFEWSRLSIPENVSRLKLHTSLWLARFVRYWSSAAQMLFLYARWKKSLVTSIENLVDATSTSVKKWTNQKSRKYRMTVKSIERSSYMQNLESYYNNQKKFCWFHQNTLNQVRLVYNNNQIIFLSVLLRDLFLPHACEWKKNSRLFYLDVSGAFAHLYSLKRTFRKTARNFHGARF